MTLPVIRAQISGIKPTSIRSNIVDIDEFCFSCYHQQDTIVFPLGKSYTQNTNSVFLFVDGKLLPKAKYEETNSNTITLKFQLLENTEVVVRWFRYNPAAPATVGHIVASEQEPDDSKKTPGLIWLKPSSKNMKIYTGSGFEDIALKKDVESMAADPAIDNSRLYGGSF